MEFLFNASGTIAEPDEKAWEQADGDGTIIALSKGVQANGVAYYAFVAVRPSKYAEFYRLSKARQPLDLEAYGKIIAAGAEANPPHEVMKYMADVYGFDVNFEKELDVQFQKARREFAVKQEDARLMDIVAIMKARET